jgi:hypothetical protein
MTDYYVVRPNLGQPLILTPSQLKSFEITVAGVSPKDDSPFNPQKPECPKLEEVIDALRDLQITWYTGQRFLVFPLKFREWVMQPDLYVDMDPEIWIFNPNPSEHFPFSIPSPFPQNAIEHQHLAGFRWEGRLKVEIDVPDTREPEGGWPAMCDIRLGGRTNFHAVYVTEQLPNPDDFKFMHLTDTHVAGRHDLIPQVICQHLEPWQQKIFRARYRNPNDHLRAVIRYANEQKPDFIVLTGDVIDYYHDGYFAGDTYHYGYGKSAPTDPSPDTSNVRTFVDIITGRDGIGEALTIPIFVVPGNHEYYPYESLGVVNLDPELEPPLWMTVVRILLPVLASGPLGLLFALGAWVALFVLPSEFWHMSTSSEIDEELDRYRGFQLNKIEMGLFDLWKKGEDLKYTALAEDYRNDWYDSFPADYEETLSLYQAARYVTPKWEHFGDYLTNISYDTDFLFSIGNHQFICLNTGQDVHLPSVSKIISKKGDPKAFEGGERRFLEHHPQNRGYIPEHGSLLATAQQRAGEQDLIFLFNHAPFFHHKGDPKPPSGMSEAGRTGRTNDLARAPADMDLDYDIGEGLFQLIGESCDNFTISFAGHTHGKSEYRVSIEKNPEMEKKFGIICWVGRYSEILGGSPQRLDYYRPLFFTSGSLRSRHPMVREVQVSQDYLAMAQMNKYIRRFRQVATAGPMACLLTAVVSNFAGVAGYKGIMRVPIDSSFLMQLGDRTAQMDRALVMWDMIENFKDMWNYLNFVLMLGGYWQGFFGDLYGICDEQNLSFHRYIVGWDELSDNLLQRRNVEPPRDLSGEEKIRQRYAHLRSIHDQIDLFLKQISGWVPYGGDPCPPSWYEDKDNYEPLWPTPMCRLNRLLEANIAVWLNRFGLQPDEDGPNCLDLECQFNIIDPQERYLNFGCQKHILEIFEFATLDDDNPLRLWYTFESTYLAELGGYKVQERNERVPSVHLDWARSLPRDAIIADIIVKYQLQAEHQLKKLGIDSLRRFYSTSAARLASWAATSDSVNPEDYMKKCEVWSDQEILNDLTRLVNLIAQKLIIKEE